MTQANRHKYTTMRCHTLDQIEWYLMAMDFKHFKLWPRPSASIELQEQIGQILENFGLSKLAPTAKELIVYVEDPVSPGASLTEAHANWTDASAVTTPEGFPRRANSSTCPPSLIRVAVECCNRRSGGMSSYYGFEGYFLSLLINLTDNCIWDARGEAAK